eukprot:CAMPEP_0185036600 /NCGR_PEP_ID=MMETSP1103-20130426/29785_1 /TAXON_ID=36769 /ORGANISM="Paraphysomonas bandaiensis, Strain Caron Lab Isolate" /LENGTH=1507 /DNA_ID=CAMNT_0027574191 /DNA_START=159 /DNA_END=4679 /DNA_ORIENTATION=-
MNSWMEMALFTASCWLLVAVVRRKRKNRKLHHLNPKVQGTDRLETHSALMGFVSEIDARNFVLQPKCSPFVLFLDNKWAFSLCKSFTDAINLLGDREVKRSRTYCVPRPWQLESSGDSIQHRHNYVDPECEVPPDNPAGYYQYDFVVPREWISRQLRLHFGGADSALYVWVNGQFVGFSKDSKLPAEFNVSSHVKYGRPNSLEVIVMKYSDGSCLESQQTWKLSGLCREVYIVSLPQPVRICDFSWSMDDSSRISIDGKTTVFISIKLEWDTAAPDTYFSTEVADSAQYGGVYPRRNLFYTSAEWSVCTALYEEGVMTASTAGPIDGAQYFAFDNPKTQPMSKVRELVTPPPIFSQESTDQPGISSSSATFLEVGSQSLWTSTITHAHSVKHPKLWSAERPYVYTLVIMLRNSADGNTIQAESCRVALRTVDISNGLLRVNCKPILIRGTNLSEHHPVSGSVSSRQLIEADIQLMKRNNFNALRTAHNPHHSWIYELCTLYGIYVVDVANMEIYFSSLDRLLDAPDWEMACMLRLIRMYERDKIHPSVIAWSLGSKSGYGKIHDKMAQYIRQRDPSRLVMYEPASYGPRNGTSSTLQSRYMATDILCPMHAQVGDCIVMANRFPDLPVVLSEYCRMVGNSGGGLQEYWDAFHTFTRLQGGFLYEWADQGLVTTSSYFGRSWHYSGDNGDHYVPGSTLLNGLTWPHRGIDSILYDESEGCTSLVSPVGIRPCGLWTSTDFAFHDFKTKGVLLKPQLLEAKESMKYFDCSVYHVDFTQEYLTVEKSAERNTSVAITAKLRISNLMDHVEDLTSRFYFDSILLCDGAVVACAPFIHRKSALVHRHLGGDEVGGRRSYQELKGICGFEVPVHVGCPNHPPCGSSEVSARGIPWPEELHMSPYSLSRLQEKLDSSIASSSFQSVQVTKQTVWSIVLIGRLVSPTSFAPAGYPIGFKQVYIHPRQLYANIHTRHPQEEPIRHPAIRDCEVCNKQVGSSPTFNITLNWIAHEACIEPNILLRAEYTAVELEGKPQLVEAVVSSQKGCLESLHIDGVNVLAEPAVCDGVRTSCGFSIHRAPTAVDQKGYASAWKAAGMDREMRNIPMARHSNPSKPPTVGMPVCGHTELTFMDVDHVFIHQKSAIPGDSDMYFGEGVRCTWDMTPMQIDRGRVMILLQVQRFVNDSSTRSVVIEVRSNGQELFLHELASSFGLGKETILPSESSNTRGPEESAKVRLWKLSFYPSSVIPYVEVMSSRPLANMRYDEVDTEIGMAVYSQSHYDTTDDNESSVPVCESDSSDCSRIFSVRWSVSYVFDCHANFLIKVLVDLSSLPCPPPRIGVHMNIKDCFDSCTWLGNGPHENYPDRKTSSIFALHRAPVEALHVPYIIPVDNSNRYNVRRLQFEEGCHATVHPDLSDTDYCEYGASIGGTSPDELEGISANKPWSFDISCCRPFNFRAQPYFTEDVATAYDIRDVNRCKNSFTCVNIDPYVMGVGSGDNWSLRVSDDNLLQPGVY